MCCRFNMSLFEPMKVVLIRIVMPRPKRSLLPLIESKFSSKRQIHSLQSIPAAGQVWPWQCATYTNTRVLEVSTKDIQQHCYEYSPTPPSNFWHMNKSERSSFHPETKKRRFAA